MRGSSAVEPAPGEAGRSVAGSSPAPATGGQLPQNILARVKGRKGKGTMDTKFWAKLRPTAVIFAAIMGVLVWVLTSKVLGGEMGALAFGDGQAGAILSATLIVIGTAIGGLSNGVAEAERGCAGTAGSGAAAGAGTRGARAGERVLPSEPSPAGRGS